MQQKSVTTKTKKTNKEQNINSFYAFYTEISFSRIIRVLHEREDLAVFICFLHHFDQVQCANKYKLI